MQLLTGKKLVGCGNFQHQEVKLGEWKTSCNFREVVWYNGKFCRAMIKSKVGSIKSGWRSVFMVFTAAADDELESMVFTPASSIIKFFWLSGNGLIVIKHSEILYETPRSILIMLCVNWLVLARDSV